MRKNIMILFMLMIVLFFTACKKKVEHYGVEAKGPSYENLKGMEDDSAIIVKVIRQKEEKPVTTFNDEKMVSGYTFSQVKVEEIFKDTTNTLEIGDSIRMLENEVFNEKENVVYHIGGYNMMVEGKEYLLFLNKYIYYDKEPYYVATGTNFGTVSIENDKRSTVYSDRNGKSINDFQIMQPIWEEALEKYINQ